MFYQTIPVRTPKCFLIFFLVSYHVHANLCSPMNIFRIRTLIDSISDISSLISVSLGGFLWCIISLVFSKCHIRHIRCFTVGATSQVAFVFYNTYVRFRFQPSFPASAATVYLRIDRALVPSVLPCPPNITN